MLVIERVWREKRELLNIVARSVAPDDGVAEDLLQEAFARALESKREMKDPEAAFRFICRILTNVAIDDHRRRRRLQRIIGSLPRTAEARFVKPAVTSASPLCLLIGEETGLVRTSVMEEIRQAMLSLPDKQREALDVMFDEARGMTLQEFCRERGVPYSTLRSRMLKAVDLIRGRLRRKGLLARSDEVQSA